MIMLMRDDRRRFKNFPYFRMSLIANARFRFSQFFGLASILQIACFVHPRQVIYSIQFDFVAKIQTQNAHISSILVIHH
ncbi:hypothetical protein EUGRSUZ_L01026 [Eucalyptus grandis]|uniref:Uncharacterized protein n=1 Tax=Eucalyptus grandis TaxID=71139 RepID=A0A058ZU27_EUCGR|nr:hypothetical protein EUGRSUZ_L01026 [Eucalyptus grandis]